MTAVCLMLHSHLPWVLHHGRWPHGSDWLCEAAVDTYLPLLATLQRLQADDVPAPVTLGVTPVLANQLAHPDFATELRHFLAQRLAACDEAPASLARTGDRALLPLVRWWRDRHAAQLAQLDELNDDLVGAFRAFADAGRLELVGSAATHGFLPLLGCDESLRLQLRLGQAEHRRLFGRSAEGCWMPECAYRPAGPWEPLPDAPGAGVHRAGLERFVAGAGFRYAFVDAHLVAGGTPLGASGGTLAADPSPARDARSPDRVHCMRDAETGRELALFARNPRLSAQVWSRAEGYPGDGRYLEFHKQRWPGGLKLWRVTGPDADLGAKAPYEPDAARLAAARHAEHFAAVAAAAGRAAPGAGSVLCAPFDTELFGHWWFEGPDFLDDLYRALAQQGGPVPLTARAALARAGRGSPIALPAGSWGANGDWSMWLSPETAWTWRRLWPLERRFWLFARLHLGDPAAHPALAQAARALLLAQSSDWQFIISTGAAADYAERRFAQHCHDLEQLLDALGTGDRGATLAVVQHRTDDCFPTVLDAVAEVVRGAT